MHGEERVMSRSANQAARRVCRHGRTHYTQHINRISLVRDHLPGSHGSTKDISRRREMPSARWRWTSSNNNTVAYTYSVLQKGWASYTFSDFVDSFEQKSRTNLFDLRFI